jgi:hypothetical protein
LTSYRIGARARAEHRQSGRQRDKAACRLSLREADAEAACQDFGNCHHRLEPIARSSLVSGKPAINKIHLLVVRRHVAKRLANPHCVCPLLNMPAWLCPRPPANRETAATEMVQPAEQQQQQPPQSVHQPTLQTNETSPQRGVFWLWQLGNPTAQHLAQLGASEHLNNCAQSANLL